MLFITIQPFVKWYWNIYLFGSSEGKRLSRTPVSDNVPELCLSSSYKLNISFQTQPDRAQGMLVHYLGGHSCQGKKAGNVHCKKPLSSLLLSPLVDFSSRYFSSCTLCANGERKKNHKYQHYLSKLQKNTLSSEEIGTFEKFLLLLLLYIYIFQNASFRFCNFHF